MPCQRILQSATILVLATAFFAGCTSQPAAAPITGPAPASTAATAPTAIAPARAATSTAVTAAPANTAPVAVAAAPVSRESFFLFSEALKGNLLGDSAARPVDVLLPPGYSTSNKRYPVVYYLHGYGWPGTSDSNLGGMEDWYQEGAAGFAASRQAATGDFRAAIQRAMQSGVGQEMILVFPNATTKLKGSYYLSSPTNGDYETYLTKELVDYVDSHYRTLPQRESRAVAGCSMGGDGAAHLALKFPAIYGVAVAQSGAYFWDRRPRLVNELGGEYPLSLAAAVAPNANRPPYYGDEITVTVDGKTEVAPDFTEKLKAADPRSDIDRYLAQPQRLNALLVQHGQNDPMNPVQLSQDFDRLLTQKGVAHEFADSFDGHCSFDMVPPMLTFLSDHLVGEKGGE